MYGLLLQPPSLEHCDDKQYKIIIHQWENKTKQYDAAVNQCTIRVPSEDQTLNISAVTSCGASPPADVLLRDSGAHILYSKYENDKPAVQKEKKKKILVSNCLGEPGPVLKEFCAANDTDVLVSWSWPQSKRWPIAGGELLHYVLEWTSIPEAELQWQILAKDQSSRSISGTDNLSAHSQEHVHA